MPDSRHADRPRARTRAFTLVELIFVMVLLIIVASMVAPRMSSFFRGRVLSSEARRILSVINYARSQAIAEGVPVLLWIDVRKSAYGLEVPSSHGSVGGRMVSFTADPIVTLETPSQPDAPASELGDEKLGLPENLAAIRFNPDGFFDEGSVNRIVVRQGTEEALEIVPTANRLGYEIHPTISSR